MRSNTAIQESRHWLTDRKDNAIDNNSHVCLVVGLELIFDRYNSRPLLRCHLTIVGIFLRQHTNIYAHSRLSATFYFKNTNTSFGQNIPLYKVIVLITTVCKSAVALFQWRLTVIQ